MSSRKLRWLTVGLFASASAGLLAITSVMNSAFAYGEPAIAADAADPATALIMGPSGIPVPPPTYVDAVNDLYIQRFFPGATPVPLTTPEGLYPLTGVNSLPGDTSVAQGVATLNNAILQQIQIPGNTVDVFGYSQSSVISSMEMSQLANEGVPSSDVSFILVGDEGNPDGGFAERFVGLSLPSFGVTASGATPSDLYPTDIYTAEYDGFADFPRYPIDFLSDLNAYVGIAYEHFAYADLTPQQIAGATDLGTYGDTTYYIIPEENLPLLDPLRYLPGGNPLADLLQPDLKILVNLGYGSIYQGYDTQNAPDVPTPFGLFPTNLNPVEVLTALVQGIPQGISAAIADIEAGQWTDYSSLQGFFDDLHTFGLTPSDNPTLSELLGAVATYFNGGVPTTPITASSSPEDIVNILTSVASKDISTVLPFFDNGFAQGVSVPNYDVSLFLDNLVAGNLVGAIGSPIAADLGILPLPAILTGGPVIEAAATTLYDLFGGLVGGLVP
jgi:hypothetical protein